MKNQKQWEALIKADFEEAIKEKTLSEIKLITYDVIHSLWCLTRECELIEGINQRREKRNLKTK